MTQLFTNFAATTLASGITSGDLTGTVVDGSKMPSPSGGDFFMLTLATAGAETTREIVKVTSRSSNTLTWVRAQEGTAASAFSTGDKAELRDTASLSTKEAKLITSVFKMAHGFTTGQAVYFDGTNWQLAKSNAVATLGIGLVFVIDANYFDVYHIGIVTGLPAATPSTATNEAFSPTGTSGQLSIGGQAVVSSASVTSLINTNWQGTKTLSITARTNYVLQSQDTSVSATWVPSGMTTSSGYTDPKGGTTLIRMYETTANTFHGPAQASVAVANAQQYLIEFFVDKNSTRLILWDNDSAAVFAVPQFIEFNPATGAIVATGGLNSSGVVDTGTGFWRVWAVTPASASAGSMTYEFSNSYPSFPTISYVGDVTKWTAIWGMGFYKYTSTNIQAYIPTTTAAATVTDYSYTGAGAVTLGQTASGTYVWNGSGILTGTAIVAGQYYYVSDAVAGQITSVAPTSTSSFSNIVMLALTSTSGVVLPYRPLPIV